MNIRTLLVVSEALLYLACDSSTAAPPGSDDVVASVQVQAPQTQLEAGATMQLTAVPRNRSGAPLAGRSVSWASTDTMVAKVSADGVVNARRAGSARISAASEGREGFVVLTVRAARAAVAAVIVDAGERVSLPAGGRLQLTATARAANDSVLADRVITWSSSNAAIAAVDAAGMIAAFAPGSAMVRAASEGVEARVTVEVTAVPIARVVPTTGGVVTLYTGDSQQLGIRTFAADGSELTGRPVSWSTADDSIATVSSSGMVVARRVGSTDVYAEVEGHVVSLSIDVRSRIQRVDMSPAAVVLGVGEETVVEATLRDAQNAVLERQVHWTSSDESVVAVDARGNVLARAAGNATIKATAEGQEGWTLVRVEAWSERALQAVDGASLPALLFVREWTDAGGAPRTAVTVALDGVFRLVLTGVNSGRYEQRFAVRIDNEGQVPQFGQYGVGGDFNYDVVRGVFVLRSWSGQVLLARPQADGTLVVTGRLGAGLPEVELRYGGF